MKQFFLTKLFLVLIFFTSCSVNNNVNSVGTQIEPALFSEKFSSGDYKIIDVRTHKEYIKDKISEKSILIDFLDANFKSNINKLSKEGKYLIHCKSGRRSSAANKIMRDLGFKDYFELRGGIIGWKKFLLEKKI